LGVRATPPLIIHLTAREERPARFASRPSVAQTPRLPVPPASAGVRAGGAARKIRPICAVGPAGRTRLRYGEPYLLGLLAEENGGRCWIETVRVTD
jgi:hypothetical protein